MCFTRCKVKKLVKSFSEMFRSSSDVLIISSVNFIVSLNGIFVNRLVTSKEIKNLSTKLYPLKFLYQCESALCTVLFRQVSERRCNHRLSCNYGFAQMRELVEA